MENLKPPPNSSPEEIQAWNEMMDTMVTFIKASTNLMNTITMKVRAAAAASSCAAMQSAASFASAKQYQETRGGAIMKDTASMADMECEPECLMCQPRPPPCGICGKKVTGARGEDLRRPLPCPPCPFYPLEPPPYVPAEPPPSPYVPVERSAPAVEASDRASKPKKPRREFTPLFGPSYDELLPDAVPKEPATVEPTPEPSMPAVPEEPAVTEPTPEPSVPVVPEEPPSVEEPATEPLPPDVTEEPPTPGESEEPPAPDVSEEPPAPGESEEPPIPEPSPEPPTPEVPAGEPAIEKPPKRVSLEEPQPKRPSIVKPPVKEPSREKPPLPPSAAGDLQCICAPIRAKRLQMQGKKSSCVCCCSDKQKPKRPMENVEMGEQIEEELPPEILCGCGPSTKEKEMMVQQMVEKLCVAQQEITNLQQEMARLQRMDTTKKTGPHATPNAAQLYQEIMRGSQTYQGTCPTIRGQGVRNLDNVRKELFQSPGWSPYDNIVRNVGGSAANYQTPQYGRGSGMRPPAITVCPPTCAPPQSRGGGFQSLPGGTVLSPDCPAGRGSTQSGGRFQSSPGGTVFSPSCPPIGEPGQSGGRGFQSLPGGTAFSPDYSQSPHNTGFRTSPGGTVFSPQDPSQAGIRSLGGGGGSSQQGRPTPAQYYQTPGQYRPSPSQRPGGQCPGYSPQASGGEAYWSRLGEYGSPAPPMQRQSIDCVCSPPKVEPQRQVIICMPPEDRKR